MTTEEILQILNEKFGTIQNQSWFVSLQKTAHSKNITTAEWNSLLFHAARTSSDADTLKTCLVQFISSSDNIENGSGTGAVQQVPDSVAGGFDFTGKNPNAVKLDPNLTDATGKVDYGATGAYASSFGGKSAAMGKRSHSEGTTTIAKGAYSHAEGDNAVALGADSHAEGYKTTAYGEGSHAEGNSTVSKGEYSHAEGWHTASEGEFSHVEGNGSLAEGVSSHAEGESNTAQGVASHAEGYKTDAYGEGSHAEGGDTSSEGRYSHAEGSNTTAKGPHSHAEGTRTIARGEASHAEGYETEATGLGSHAEGVGTIASAYGQSVVGTYNEVDSDAVFIVGNGAYNGGDVRCSNAFVIKKDGTIKCPNIARSIRISLTKDFKLQAMLYHQKPDEVDANPGLLPIAYSNEIDLPLEATVMGGDFDETNKDLILTLQNEDTVRIPLDAIISGLATETDVKAVDAKSSYDHVITTEAEFLNIGNYSGNVLVKGVTLSSTPVDITLKEGTRLTFIDFNMPSEGKLSIDGTSGTVRGFHVSSLYATVTLKNFSNVKQVSCVATSSLRLVECQHISDSKFYEATSCTYIDNCDLSLLNAVYINDCKYVCGIRASSTIGVRFSNCSFISNVDCNGTYENCTYVDAESCKGFVTDEDVDKVQVITNDGTFRTAELGGNSDGGKLYQHCVTLLIPGSDLEPNRPQVQVTFTVFSKSSEQFGRQNPVEFILNTLTFDHEEGYGDVLSPYVGYVHDSFDTLTTHPLISVNYWSTTLQFTYYVDSLGSKFVDYTFNDVTNVSDIVKEVV